MLYAMPTSDDTIDRINAAMDAAIEAQEAGLYQTAASKARTAWMLVGRLPDSRLQSEDLRWKPEAIKPIVDEMNRLANGAPAAGSDGSQGAFFQSQDVLYKRG